MEVTGVHQLFGYQHSSKELLFSTEERNLFRFKTTCDNWNFWQCNFFGRTIV